MRKTLTIYYLTPMQVEGFGLRLTAFIVGECIAASVKSKATLRSNGLDFFSGRLLVLVAPDVNRGTSSTAQSPR